ncbi:MAG: restriction endonuclease subunit S [Firmicutes bacterium]|nr:restriction endonuclease subunit S [Bacillota bacterium]
MRFRKGDILFGKLRPYFRKVIMAPFDGICSTDIWVVRPKPGIDARFLFYLMASQDFVDAANRGSEGTRMPRAKWEFVTRFMCRIPPHAEQQAIACILGALDDKIELNRRMNQVLEAMARAIFKSWFIDFDPVRAKAAGRQPAGLAPHIAELFPDSFEESQIGEVPKGWCIYPLPALIDINPPRHIPRGVIAPYLDMAGMPTQGHAPDFWIRREVGSGMKFINGDTLLARITPCLENGKTAYVDFLKDGEVGWGSTEYIVLRPREPIPTVFAYLLARNSDFRAFTIQRMTGSSGRQRVPSTSLADYQIIAPAVDSLVLKVFGRIVTPLFERMRSAMEQSRTLVALRDSLLPKLIFGELRTPDAERIVGRCF